MAEHDQGFVLTRFESLMNSVRRTVGARALDLGAPVVNWARGAAPALLGFLSLGAWGGGAGRPC